MDCKYILFDLDGTLTDPFEGITKSFQYALRAYGIEKKQEELLCVIGPPLIDSFMDFFGFDEKTGMEAVAKYRERFSVVGWQENKLLYRVPEMLEALKKEGKIVALATAKPEVFARKIIEKFGISQYFDVVSGATLDGKIGTKTQVMKKALEMLGNPSPDEVVMVGDRDNDVSGAKECGVRCIGVRVGYASEGELEEAGADYIIDTIDELKEFLIK
ncbi:MAG: HAD-IA family hydrolase [Clostridia bacterium]|nr:HAD-IA family hydrolase [Clostridia bacterium]